MPYDILFESKLYNRGENKTFEHICQKGSLDQLTAPTKRQII